MHEHDQFGVLCVYCPMSDSKIAFTQRCLQNDIQEQFRQEMVKNMASASKSCTNPEYSKHLSGSAEFVEANIANSQDMCNDLLYFAYVKLKEYQLVEEFQKPIDAKESLNKKRKEK